jgi:uncharacterized Zn finger protein
MNRWDRWTQYTRGPKKPPPEHGIKMKKAGTTWWGQHWIEALEHVLGGDSGRLARGRSYARAGRVHDLVVEGGEAAAKVTGSRPKPYRTTIELVQLTDAAWAAAISAMAGKAQFAAELLAGEMPRDIDDAFRAAKKSLFPRRRSDLATSCSCPDDGDPCKHIAATHYILGEAMDRDPFLLFELRGRTKAQVLEALRAARGGGEPTAPPSKKRKPNKKEAAARPETAVPRLSLGKVEASEYDRLRGELPSLHFSFDAPVAHGSVLRQLGSPAAWQGESPEAALAPLIQRAAAAARRIAMAEPLPRDEESKAGPAAPKKRMKKAKKRGG